ncbi:hypothetical protein [Ferruginibacter sp.]|nr:hypothetical protein [Ferruginibacter sp.]
MQFNTQPYDYSSIIAKLDLDGNLIWSKSLGMNLSVTSSISSFPIYNNNTIILLGRASNQQMPGPGSESYTILTKLNDADGSIIESNAYKTISDPLVKGIATSLIKYNADNSYSMSGQIMIDLGNGAYNPSSILFNSLLDANLNSVHNYYYRNNIPLNNLEIYYDFNNQKQISYLTESINNSREKILCNI